MTGDIFQNINGQLIPARDVCARKHGGNPQSAAAFGLIKDTLTWAQQSVLDHLREYSNGATVDHMSVAMEVTPNRISGRITELRMKGKIKQNGTRKTRSGCSAAVWVVNE